MSKDHLLTKYLNIKCPMMMRENCQSICKELDVFGESIIFYNGKLHQLSSSILRNLSTLP